MSLEQVIASGAFDFVQFNYSLFDRHAEDRLLNAAERHRVATIINRPFGEGKYFARLADKPLPKWAADYGVTSPAQLLLKYLLSHPAVTCVIPATSNPEHAADNLKAGQGFQFDHRTRQKAVKWAES